MAGLLVIKGSNLVWGSEIFAEDEVVYIMAAILTVHDAIIIISLLTYTTFFVQFFAMLLRLEHHLHNTFSCTLPLFLQNLVCHLSWIFSHKNQL